MKIECHNEPFPYIRVFNFYSEEELKLIWEELEFILNDRILSSPEKTSSARHNKEILKKNKGVFLDTLYANRDTSNILSINKKFFIHLSNMLSKTNHWIFKNSLAGVNWDTTLISYYENCDHYKKHYDSSSYTCLTWFFKEPKKFSGGDLIFSDFNLKIEIENNSLIFFPSIINHEVSEVRMSPENIGKKLGRVCMSQFMGHSIHSINY